MKWDRTILASSGLVLLISGCKSIVGITDLDIVDGPGTDAAIDTGSVDSSLDANEGGLDVDEGGAGSGGSSGSGGAAGSAGTAGSGGTAGDGGSAGSGGTAGAGGSVCEVPDGGSGIGSGPWSGCDSVTGCYSVGSPSVLYRPSNVDSPNIPDFYLALTNLNLGHVNSNGKPDQSAYQFQGFDTDGYCNAECPKETRRSCKEARVDGQYCRDNSLGAFTFNLEALSQSTWVKLNNRSLNCSICTGGYSYVLKISGYNGTPNDPAVRVDIYSSAGIQTYQQFNCTDPKVAAPSTCWAKTDRWNLTDTSFVDGETIKTVGGVAQAGRSKIADEAAFVRDGRLVVFPGEMEMWLATSAPNGPVDTAPFRVRYGKISGELTQVDNSWELKNTVWAGRVRATDVIAGLPAAGVCDPQATGLIQQSVDGFRDLPDGEGPDPNSECTSLSVGMVSQWKEASLGTVVKAPVKGTCP